MPDSPPAIYTPPSLTPATPAVIATAAANRVGIHASNTANNIIWRASVSGAAGDAIAIEITTPAAATIVPSVSGTAVTVAAGSECTMGLSGADDIATDGLQYAGLSGGAKSWTSDGLPVDTGETQVTLRKAAGAWLLQAKVDGSVTYAASKTSAEDSPSELVGWTITTGTVQPELLAAGPTKAQVIAAVNASAAVAAVVTAAASGDVTGKVGVPAFLTLSGGGGLEPPAAVTP